MAQTFFMQTFGCKVNQYETEALREEWLRSGAVETDDPACADIIFVNSCAVTASAVGELRRNVRRLRREYPDAEIIVTGCAAASVVAESGRRSDRISSIDGIFLVDPRRKDALLDVFGNAGIVSLPSPELALEPKRPPFMPLFIESFKRARPVVKLQDGCSHGCAYCIVPLTRGPARSRRAAAVVSEVRRLFEAGYGEVMLSGINLSQYRSREDNCSDFWDLLALLESELAYEWAGRARLRLSSVEPGQLDTRGIDALMTSRLICPHLHISLQSGTQSVLNRMGRSHYSPKMLLDAAVALHSFWPTFGLGADIMMGFPGESAAELEETVAFIRELPLTYAHVFPYSERPQTAAASMRPSVPVAERRARAAFIRSIVADKQYAFWKSLVGRSAVLASVPGDGGITEYYTPCRLMHGNCPPHALLNVRICAADKDGLIAEPLCNCD